MIAYPDSSFIVSLYILDANSKAAAAQMALVTACRVSELTSLELLNAVAGRRFRGEISQEQMDLSWNAFRRDEASGLFIIDPFPEGVFDRARSLAREYTSRLGSRALDVLHVAAAMTMGATAFYTFDLRQARLARAAGLSVRPRLPR